MKIIEKIAAKAQNADNPRPTIAFLGDSVTEGCFELIPRNSGGFNNVFDRESVYHKKVSEILGVLFPTVPVNIINAGIAGTKAPYGLSRIERDVISKNPGLTQKMLADMGGVKPSTINVMLVRMSRNELVEIKKDKNNSKLSRVYITEKGKRLCEEALEYKKAIHEKQYMGFTEEEIKVFKSMLSRMNKNLTEELNKEEKFNENN